MEIMQPFTSMVDIIGSREKEHTIESWFDFITKRALAVIENHENTDMVEKVKNIMKSPFLKVFNECVDAKQTKYAVLCHGDCWNNNIMYKYKVQSFDFNILTDFLSNLNTCKYIVFFTPYEFFIPSHYINFFDAETYS